METIAERLNRKNLKATPQRIAIYEYLLASKEHPNVETIYGALKPDYPSISLATVYKTVASLRDARLLLELNVGEDSFRYDACTHEHAHVICRKCRKVFDIELPEEMEKQKKKVSAGTNMDIDTCMVYFYGICEDCWMK